MDAPFRQNLAIYRQLRRDRAARFAELQRADIELKRYADRQITESLELLRRLARPSLQNRDG